MNFYPILRASVLASVSALVVWWLKWLFREHLPPSWHVAVWFIVLLRLCPFLPVWRTDFSLWNNVDVTRGVQAVQAVSSRAAYREAHGADAPLPVVTDQIHNDRHYETAPVKRIGGGETLFAVWALGAGGLFLWFAGSAAALGWRVRRYPEADAAVTERIARLREDYPALARTARAPRAVLAPTGASPYVFGLIRPVLVLPAGMADTLDDRALLHELAHLGRGDLLANWLLTAIRCTQWFNPVLWKVCDRIADDLELCCDEAVLRALDNEEARRGYGHLLLDLALPHGGRRPGTSHLASGAQSMRRRVTQLARRKEITGRARGVGYLVFAMAALVCLTAAKYTPTEFASIDRLPQGVLHTNAEGRLDSTPENGWRAALEDAESFRAKDAAQAAALYGQAQALDNGYLAWLVADDAGRAALEAQFEENERSGALPWHFDDTVTQNYYYAPYFYEENPSELQNWLDHEVSAGFAVYDLVGGAGRYTATIFYPVTQYDDRYDVYRRYRYYFDEITIEEQDGRYLVPHAARQRCDQSWEEYGMAWNRPALAVYRAEDENAVYEVRMHYAETCLLRQFRISDGTWLEKQQPDPLWSMFGWGGDVTLPGSLTNGYQFDLCAKPKNTAFSSFTFGGADGKAYTTFAEYGSVSPSRGSDMERWWGRFDHWEELDHCLKDENGFYTLCSFLPRGTELPETSPFPQEYPFFIERDGHAAITHFDLVEYCGQEVTP